MRRSGGAIAISKKLIELGAWLHPLKPSREALVLPSCNPKTMRLAKRGGPDDLALMVPYLRRVAWLDSPNVRDAFARPLRPEWVVPMRRLEQARASDVRKAALQWLGRALYHVLEGRCL